MRKTLLRLMPDWLMLMLLGKAVGTFFFLAM